MVWSRLIVVLIILVVDFSMFVDCQQKLGVGNSRSYFSNNQYPQYQYRPQYQQGYQTPNYNWQYPQNQWQYPQNQWQYPQNQWPWGQNQWGNNQLPQIPQLSPFSNIPKPSIGQVLDTTLDIIKKTQQAFQFIPRTNIDKH